MVDTSRYAEVLTQVLRRVAIEQPSLQNLKIRAVCDGEVNQFLVIGTGWEKRTWMDVILFHAWLRDGQVVIEENNFESIVMDLIRAGIAESDIIAADDWAEVDPLAA
jgi:XisI protein